MEIAPFIIALIFILVGLAGIIIPGLPDIIFIFLGILIFALWTGFKGINFTFLLIFFGLTVFSYLFDWLGLILGAKTEKATLWGIFGAVIGAILGIFLGGIIGMILLAFVGTILFELIFAKKDIKKALKAGAGSTLGMIFGILFKFVLAAVMIGLFFAKIF